MRPVWGALTVSDTGEIQPDERLNCCLGAPDGTVVLAMAALRLSPLFADALVAHQGGWDEIMWVLVPIVAMVGLLRVATLRVRNKARNQSDRGDIGAE
jgi:hypothetical protein